MSDRIIVVDDGSQDRTAEVAKLAGGRCHPVGQGWWEGLCDSPGLGMRGMGASCRCF